MSKVLILINSSGGLYDFRNEFVKALLKDNQVYVSVPDDVKIKELEEEGCRMIRTPINRRGVNPKEDWKLYRTYRSLMKELGPDLVITYTIKPNIYGGLARPEKEFHISPRLPDWAAPLTGQACF